MDDARLDQGRDLVPIPDDLDAAEAETLVVNGITAWQMLHRKARASQGHTILVHGANGGVGNTLVQLARRDGIRVIGTASPRHHGALREMGAEPIAYDDPLLSARVRELAPDGVNAVFDHLGGPSFERSFNLLADGGTLVAYGTATQIEENGNLVVSFGRLCARLGLWRMLPNGRKRALLQLLGRQDRASQAVPAAPHGRLDERVVAPLGRRHHAARRRAQTAERGWGGDGAG